MGSFDELQSSFFFLSISIQEVERDVCKEMMLFKPFSFLHFYCPLVLLSSPQLYLWVRLKKKTRKVHDGTSTLSFDGHYG